MANLFRVQMFTQERLILEDEITSLILPGQMAILVFSLTTRLWLQPWDKAPCALRSLTMNELTESPVAL